MFYCEELLRVVDHDGGAGIDGGGSVGGDNVSGVCSSGSSRGGGGSDGSGSGGGVETNHPRCTKGDFVMFGPNMMFHMELGPNCSDDGGDGDGYSGRGSGGGG
ncbi:hypothetical protein Dsin_020406 [Dipteronia sinensis]|uniref:Uncharacterized protein n=1 Tax=Dipteronia sinensis TaxID=43782 RepID=A0AAE0A9E6_9ROSI|nr:hypothetical protein Dsin_020406 [Dipteronia sinensis]